MPTDDFWESVAPKKVKPLKQPRTQGGQVTAQEIDDLLKGEHAPKIKQFFEAVRWAEGGEPNIIVGGKKRFDPNGDHPNIVGLVTKEGKSTAAGNYQITGSNWYGGKGRTGLKQRLGAKNFSPDNQLRAALMLFGDRDNRAGLEALKRGDIDTAIEIAKKDWAAVPGSKLHVGKSGRNRDEFLKKLGQTQNKDLDSFFNSLAPEGYEPPQTQLAPLAPTDLGKVTNNFTPTYPASQGNPNLLYDDSLNAQQANIPTVQPPVTNPNNPLQTTPSITAPPPQQAAPVNTDIQNIAEVDQPTLQQNYKDFLTASGLADNPQTLEEYNRLIQLDLQSTNNANRAEVDKYNQNVTDYNQNAQKNTTRQTVQQPVANNATQPVNTQVQPTAQPQPSQDFQDLTIGVSVGKDKDARKATNNAVIARLGQMGYDAQDVEEVLKRADLSGDDEQYSKQAQFNTVIGANFIRDVERQKQRRVDLEGRRQRAEQRIAGGSDVDEAALQEGLLTPEQFTTRQYEKQLEAEREQQAQAEYLAKNTRKVNDEADFAGSMEGGVMRYEPTSERQAKADRSAQEKLAEIVKDYGSVRNYNAEQARIEKDYELRPLARPLEFAKNFYKAVPKAVSSVLKTSSIATELATAPMATIIDAVANTDLRKSLNADNGFGMQAGKYLDDFIEQNAPANKDFRNEFFVTTVPDTLGQLAIQIGLGAATGGASLPTALGVSMGASSQYEEAGKFTKDQNTKLLAAVIGGGLASTDAILFNKWFKTASATDKTGFLANLKNSIIKRLGGEVGEKEATEFAEIASQTFLKKLANAGKKGITEGFKEGTQEVSENKGNDALAAVTYDRSQARKDRLTSITNEDIGSFLGGFIGGTAGSAVQTRLEQGTVAERNAEASNISAQLDRMVADNEITPEVAEQAKTKIDEIKAKPAFEIRRENRLKELGYAPEEIADMSGVEKQEIVELNKDTAQTTPNKAVEFKNTEKTPVDEAKSLETKGKVENSDTAEKLQNVNTSQQVPTVSNKDIPENADFPVQESEAKQESANNAQSKQPYEMTRDEFAKELLTQEHQKNINIYGGVHRQKLIKKYEQQVKNNDFGLENTSGKRTEWGVIVDSQRKQKIEKALKDGKTVPAEVLADYPDLVEKYGNKLNEKTKNEVQPLVAPLESQPLVSNQPAQNPPKIRTRQKLDKQTAKQKARNVFDDVEDDAQTEVVEQLPKDKKNDVPSQQLKDAGLSEKTQEQSPTNETVDLSKYKKTDGKMVYYSPFTSSFDYSGKEQQITLKSQPDADVFIAPAVDNRGKEVKGKFVVVDGLTGMSITNPASKREAIAEAEKNIQREDFDTIRQKSINKYGVSPRYTEQTQPITKGDTVTVKGKQRKVTKVSKDGAKVVLEGGAIVESGKVEKFVSKDNALAYATAKFGNESLEQIQKDLRRIFKSKDADVAKIVEQIYPKAQRLADAKAKIFIAGEARFGKMRGYVDSDTLAQIKKTSYLTNEELSRIEKENKQVSDATRKKVIDKWLESQRDEDTAEEKDNIILGNQVIDRESIDLNKKRRDLEDAGQGRFTDAEDNPLLKTSTDFDSAEFERELESIEPVRNDKGKLLAPNGKVSNLQNERLWKTVRTKAFKKWFGQSKAVDENNEPLVVYHGTGADIASFDISRKGQNFDQSILGVYFTNNPVPNLDKGFGWGSSASEYALLTKTQPNVIPVFLSIQNPVDINADGFYSPNVAVDKQRTDIQRWAKRDNNDGVISQYKEEGDGDIEKIFVAFNPNQIKSIFNIGSFDTEQDSILLKAQDEDFEQSAEDLLLLPETQDRLANIGVDIDTIKEKFLAKTENYQPNVYYHATGGMAEAGVGQGLYLGKDRDALDNFYNIDGGKVEVFNGKANFLDLTDYDKFAEFESEAGRRFGKLKNNEQVRKLTLEQGYDGIRYYDPEATGEEFVVFRKGLFDKKQADIREYDNVRLINGDAVQELERLVEQGEKFDAIFLDPPYFSKALIGGSRGIKDYGFITPEDFGDVMRNVNALVKTWDSHVYLMLSGARTAQVDMQKYLQQALDKGFELVEEGSYNKTFKDGSPVTNVRGEVAMPEKLYLLTKSGKARKGEIDTELNFTSVRPTVSKSYQTQKANDFISSIIRQSTLKGEKILDPFAGSGVTGVESQNNNRQATLIEKSAETVNNVIHPNLSEPRQQTLFKARDKQSTALVKSLSKSFKQADAVGITATNNGLGVEVNEQGAEMLKRAMKQAGYKVTGFDGAFNNPKQTQDILTALEDIAVTMESLDIGTKGIDSLIDAVEDYSKDNQGVATVYLYDDAIPHEKTHEVMFTNAVDKHNERMFGDSKILKDKAFDKAKKKLEKLSKSELSDGEVLQEMFAYISTDDHLALGLTAEEAGTWYHNALTQYAETNGDSFLNDIEKWATKDTETYEQIEKVRKRQDAGNNQTESSEVGNLQEEPQQSASDDRPSQESGSFKPNGKEKLSATPQTARDADIPIADRVYTSVTNQAQIEFANRKLDEGIDKATEWMNTQIADNNPQSGATTVVGMSLMQELGKQGRFDEMNAIADGLVPMITDYAQAIQALAIFSAHSPDTAGAYAVKVAKQRGNDIKPVEVEKANELAKDFSESAKAEGLAKKLLEDATARNEALKAEVSELKALEKSLENRNTNLSDKLADIRKEVRNLKNRLKRFLDAKPQGSHTKQAHKELLDRKDDILKALKGAFKDNPLLMVAGEKGIANLSDATIRLQNLSVAREMETAGKDAKTIWLATGWEKGGDGKWKTEMPDGDFKSKGMFIYQKMRELDPNGKYSTRGQFLAAHPEVEKEANAIPDFLDGNKHTADSIFDAPELFKAYPELKDYTIQYVRTARYSGVGGGFDAKTKSIIFSDFDTARETALHELQHGIQEIEGFAQGGDTKGIGGVDEYIRLGGEVEARNVESRRDMSAEERAEKALFETEDVARESQIYLQNALSVSESNPLLKATDDQRQNLIDYASIQILEGKSYDDVISGITALTNESAEYAKDVHAQAVTNLRPEKRDLTAEQKTLRKTLAKHYREADKLIVYKISSAVDAISRVGVAGDYSDEAIFTALARHSGKLPNEIAQMLENEFGITQPKPVLADGNTLFTEAKEYVKNMRIQKENEYNLSAEDIEAVKREQNFARRESQIAQRKIQNFYNGLVKSKTMVAVETLVNFRRANLLTGLKTQFRNLLGNLSQGVSEETIRPAIWLADAAASVVTGQKTVQGISPKGIIKGFQAVFGNDETLKNLDMKSGIAKAKEIWLYGDSVDEMSKLQHSESILSEKFDNKLAKGVDWYINHVFRTLGGADALFKVYAFRRSIEEQAATQAKDKTEKAKLIANPTAVMQKQASDYADFMTFQNDNALSSLFTKFKNLHPGVKTVSEILVPYDRTPTNIVLNILEHSPLGLVKAGISAKNVFRPNAKKFQKFSNDYRGAVTEDTAKEFGSLPKGEQRKIVDEALSTLFTREQQQKFAWSVGRAGVGTSVYTLGFFLAAAGILTGSMSPDDDDRTETNEFFERMKGGIENRSINTKYGRFVLPDGVLFKVLTAGASAYEQAALAKKKNSGIKATALGLSESFGEELANQPLLSSSGSVIQTIKKAKAGEFAGNLAGGLIPTLISDIGEVMDSEARTGSGYDKKNKRETIAKELEFQGKGFKNSLTKRVPILRTFTADKSTGGVPQAERGGVLRRILRAVDPFSSRYLGQGRSYTARPNQPKPKAKK